MGGECGRSTEKIFAQGKIKRKKFMHANLNPRKYSCYGLKIIHTRNLITKKKSCSFLQLENTPPPPITFLMVRPLPRLATHNRGERCVTSLKTAAKETILIPNIVHNTAGTRERIGGLEMNLSGLK